jgi:hypothetical protein
MSEMFFGRIYWFIRFWLHIQGNFGKMGLWGGRLTLVKETWLLLTERKATHLLFLTIGVLEGSLVCKTFFE